MLHVTAPYKLSLYYYYYYYIICDRYGGRESLTTPVIHQDKSKDVVLGIVDADWFTELVAGADKERHFQLQVQKTTWTKHWTINCTQ